MKKNTFIFILLYIVMDFGAWSQANVLDWAYCYGSASGFQEVGTSVTYDAAGNLYAIGYFSGTVDFDPGPGIFNMSAMGPSHNVYILKLNADGEFVWARKFSGYSDSRPWDLILDSIGNVYITGQYYNTTDFDPSINDFVMTPVGVEDIFITKLDPSGNFMWAKSIGGSANDVGRSIAMDSNGNLIITGVFQGNNIDFDPGPGANLISSVSFSSDVFVLKLTPQGNFIWAKTLGGNGSEEVGSMVLDNSNNIYIGGSFQNTMDFDPGVGVSNLTASGRDAFLLKLDSVGTFVWAGQMGGTGTDQALGLTRAQSGQLYVSGRFEATADLDPGIGVSNWSSQGVADAFVCRITDNGTLTWVKTFGSTGTDLVRSVYYDETNERIFLAGDFTNVVDFDPGLANFDLTATGITDGFTSLLDSSGNFVTAYSMGGTLADVGNSVCFSPGFNKVATTGSYQGTADFGPGAETFNHTSNGNTDIYIQQVFLCTAPPNPEVTSSEVTICSGTVAGLSGDGIGILTWHSDSVGGILLATGNSFSTSLLTDTTIFYVQDSSVCGISPRIPVTVSPYNLAVLTATQNDITCFGEANGSISIGLLNGVGPYAYSWSPGFPAGDSTSTISSLIAGSYTCTITDDNACLTTYTGIITEPSLITSTQNLNICNGDMVMVGNNVYTTSGTYSDTLTSINGCDSVVTTQLIVSVPIDVTSTASGMTITANFSGGTYQWIDCITNTDIINATSASYTSPVNGSFAVAISTGGCTDTSNCILLLTLGEDMLHDNLQLSVYPNPASEVVTVKMDVEGYLELVNLSGKVLITEAFDSNLNLNVSHLPDGYYFLRIKTSQGLYTRTLIMQ